MLSNGLGPWHLLILGAVVVALFGAKRLPETARGLGRSLKILRSELRGETDSDSAAAEPPKPSLNHGEQPPSGTGSAAGSSSQH
jgi:sec-independent protein translocase protein TatA